MVEATDINDMFVTVNHIHRTLEQDPNAPGFWTMWQRLMWENGAQPGDIVVSSELYGSRVAEIIQGRFFPYDPDRSIYPISGTAVRNDSWGNFHHIVPEFQKVIRKRVTLFGAESTGKTTLSKDLATLANGHWLF
jgi:hypothetical protein